MKSKKFWSTALLVGAFAVAPAWGQDSQTDRLQDNSKPGTASKSGTGSGGSISKDPMSNMNKGMGSKGSSTLGGESQTDRIQDNSKAGTASGPGTGSEGNSSTDPMGTMNKGTMGNHGDVKSVQQALRDKGFDPGPIDGKMGSKTRAALRSYQQSKNMNPTGQLDGDTSGQLGVSPNSDSR